MYELSDERLDIWLIVLAARHPKTCYEIQKEYEHAYQCSLNIRKSGYSTLEEYLDAHPRLESVLVGVRKCYIAKFDRKIVRSHSSATHQMNKKDRKRRGRGRRFQFKQRDSRNYPETAEKSAHRYLEFSFPMSGKESFSSFSWEKCKREKSETGYYHYQSMTTPQYGTKNNSVKRKPKSILRNAPKSVESCSMKGKESYSSFSLAAWRLEQSGTE